MRYLVLVFSLFLSLVAPAQSNDMERFVSEITQRKFNWKNKERPHPVSETLQAINSPDFTCDCITKKDTTSPSFKGLHWIDINGDQKDDLIYSGGCKPYAETWVFLNTGKGIKFIYKSGGIITQIAKDSSSTTIHIYNEACCCAQYSDVLFIRINNLADTVSGEKEAVWYGEMPLLTPDFQQLISAKNKFKLRHTPKENNTVKPWECNDEDKIQGNVIATYKAKTPVIKLVRKFDGKQHWYFVVVPPNDAFIERKFLGIEPEPWTTYTIGWVTEAELMD